jgi:glycogen debranching enzyme
MPLEQAPEASTERADKVEARGPIGLFALKHRDAFLVADSIGDVWGRGDGLFRDDTRVLSRWTMTIGGAPPSLLGSSVSHDNVLFRANLTNRPLPQLGEHAAPEGVIHVERARFLWDQRLYERWLLTNYGERDVPASVAIDFGADFADIFEVRGYARPARGRTLAPQVSHDRAVLGYEGLDGVVRTSHVSFSRAPDRLTPSRAEFKPVLARRTELALYVEVGPDHDVRTPTAARFREAVAHARIAMRARRRRGATLHTPARPFNVWLDKSRSDIALLTTDLPTGPYPYAGIPWFSTTFGRDAVITALQTLWLDPTLARGVLEFLAENQARDWNAFADAAPGKIMHEARRGEVTARNELPFGRYYGGVDTTPLFVMLAGAYAERTADLEFVDALWPSLIAAMEWTDGPGDSNGDGFVDYARAEATGLANQGWKDSVDSVFHADGSMPIGPIALVEVQGYVYAARRAMASLAAQRGERTRAEHWRGRAEQLRAAVESRFWMPKDRFYAIAIDGRGEPCRVRTSNAGQLLWTGLPSPARAAHVTRQLLESAFDSGWGIRTLASAQARFNPMSYHDGSVWPHDTGICAAGMARYGDRGGAAHLLHELFDAATTFGMRLPELFCGFRRAPGEPPVGYPVACLPQAWSSGAVFMMLQACLGVRVDAWRRTIEIDRPELPAEIERLHVSGLAIGAERLDLVFQRIGRRTAVSPAGRVPDSVRIVVRV